MLHPPPHPLVLAPILLEKVWGGRRLERYGKSFPLKPGMLIGESWELADMPATSASGAGGAPARSIIASGPLSGRTLRDAVNLWGRELMGDVKRTPRGDFPLLVKLLDARENLSVQVHPSPAHARANPAAHLKTECWYILEAAPGALIYKGVRPGVDRRAFEAHVQDGSVVSDLFAVPAVPGELHNLPSGTVHALGAGVLVAEVQTPSDTTFRVFDWGRTGRELHVAQALDCIDFSPAPAATRLAPAERRGTLVATDFFTVEELRLAKGEPAPLPATRGPVVAMCVAGEAEIRPDPASSPADFAPAALRTGQTALIPAVRVPTATLATPSSATLLLTTLAI